MEASECERTSRLDTRHSARFNTRMKEGRVRWRPSRRRRRRSRSLAGDPARHVGGEEHREVGDVVRARRGASAAGASPGDPRSSRPAPTAKSVFTSPGAMPTTRVGPELVGELAGEVDQRRLRHVVHTEPELGAQAADRRDVDDRRPACSRTPCSPRLLRQKSGPRRLTSNVLSYVDGVDVERRAVVGVGGRVVDEDVESAEPLDRRVDARRRRRRGRRRWRRTRDRPDPPARGSRRRSRRARPACAS